MSHLYEMLNKKGLLARQSDSEDEDQYDDEIQEDEELKENKNVKDEPPVVKAALRGDALSAALLASSDDDDEDEPNSGDVGKKIGFSAFSKMSKSNSGKPNGSSGIYTMKLNQTKKCLRATQSKFDKVDGIILFFRE